MRGIEDSVGIRKLNNAFHRIPGLPKWKKKGPKTRGGPLGRYQDPPGTAEFEVRDGAWNQVDGWNYQIIDTLPVGTEGVDSLAPWAPKLRIKSYTFVSVGGRKSVNVEGPKNTADVLKKCIRNAPIVVIYDATQGVGVGIHRTWNPFHF